MCKGGTGRTPKLGILRGNDFVLQPPLSPSMLIRDNCVSYLKTFPNGACWRALLQIHPGGAGHAPELGPSASRVLNRKRLQLAGSLGSLSGEGGGTRIEQIGEGHPVPRGGSLHLLPMDPVCIFLGFHLLFLFLSAQKPTDLPTGFPCMRIISRWASRLLSSDKPHRYLCSPQLNANPGINLFISLECVWSSRSSGLCGAEGTGWQGQRYQWDCYGYWDTLSEELVALT